MSNDFLSGYHIPTITTLRLPSPPPPPPPPTFTPEELQRYQQTPGDQYQNVNRFIPPGLQGTNYVPPPPKPQKRKYDAGPGKRFPYIKETTADGQLVIFQGRDESYPDELNKLIHPLNCGLCDVKMNSIKSAKDHYESKPHDRAITNWLTKTYTAKGLEAPTVKRFIKEGHVGPNAYHCDVCDLHFGSLAHASQHFAGRKHKLVAHKLSKPSGMGYYDANNKWIRTGSKFTPTDVDGRFGIGEMFKKTTDENTPDTTTPAAGVPAPLTKRTNLLGLYCEACNVSVTSQAQMTMHLNGTKHKKKLKALFLEAALPLPTAAADNTNNEDSISESLQQSDSDLSMYRTPSGSYYCQPCNINMCHVPALQQHLIGKKHLKNVIDAKEKAKLEAQKKIDIDFKNRS
ncbi:zinc finger protein 346-like [Eurosta solidaginis]|uniref:zinc finger protein 346-like n=1 Tax=Eurosta solidaginis TaxID=178769 RepID=UPI003530FEBD